MSLSAKFWFITVKASYVFLHPVIVAVNSVSNFSLPSCNDEESPSTRTGGYLSVCRRSHFPQILGTKLLLPTVLRSLISLHL